MSGRKRAGGKQPYRIMATDDGPLTFAGLSERWEHEGHAPIEFSSIVVTAANAFMNKLHDRMPVMLTPDAWAAWLDPTMDPATLKDLIGSWPDGLLKAYPISRAVNSVKNDGAELIEPVAPH